MSLHAAIQKLAEAFARDVLQAIRGATLDELADGARATTKAARRSPGRGKEVATKSDVVGATSSPPKKSGAPSPKPSADRSKVALLVEAVRAAEGGLSAGQLQEVLGVSRTWLGVLLKQAKATGAVRMTGTNRATRYVAG